MPKYAVVFDMVSIVAWENDAAGIILADETTRMLSESLIHLHFESARKPKQVLLGAK